ncbi:MAG: DUF302 domain-containing protein [Gammaproteobacteria bacterium]|nr:DUF302 domain-containing protein [Gammaproteobacteria bacterium]MCP5136697.1 DUF302 domain-containing protein [Gammaproteobacteria bacterium]
MRFWPAFLFVLSSTIPSLGATAQADPTSSGTAVPGVFSYRTPMDMDTAYQRVYQALEGERFWVVFEADMGSRMEKMREQWGDDYNRNQLSGVRSMVFCNIDWTHRVANADPTLLALCPLHLSVYRQAGMTTVVMPRPSTLAAGSAGIDDAVALEQALTKLIRDALTTE